MFDWLSDIVKTLALVIPRITHIKSTDGAVKFSCGKAFELKPGLHWYWPITSEIYQMPVVRQTMQIPAQTISTIDGVSITVSVVIRFEIVDVMAACVHTFDFQDTIQDISQGEVVGVVCGSTYQELLSSWKEGNTGLDAKLSRDIRKKLKPFGVRLRKAFISEFSICYPIRLWHLSS